MLFLAWILDLFVLVLWVFWNLFIVDCGLWLLCGIKDFVVVRL
jgi:hypothetical protein